MAIRLRSAGEIFSIRALAAFFDMREKYADSFLSFIPLQYAHPVSMSREMPLEDGATGVPMAGWSLVVAYHLMQPCLDLLEPEHSVMTAAYIGMMSSRLLAESIVNQGMRQLALAFSFEVAGSRQAALFELFCCKFHFYFILRLSQAVRSGPFQR